MPSLLAFEHTLLRHARRAGLVSPEDRVMVAVSGGPDSMALLHVLSAWRDVVALKLAVAVVHVDHGVRGTASTDDAVFVEQTARRLSLPFFCKSLHLPRVLRERTGESVQAVARERRYASIWDVAGAWSATKVAVGHTRDDQAETVLMGMLRGAGLAGLSGMPVRRAPGLIRPMLHVSRAELLRYLERKGSAFRVDSSNASPHYMRNRLRHEVIPLLKTFNPGVVRVLSRHAALLREDHQYLEDAATAMLASVTIHSAQDEIVVSRPRFLAVPVPMQRRIIAHMAGVACGTPVAPESEAVAAMLRHVIHGRSGSTARVGCVDIRRDYDEITFSAIPSEPARLDRPALVRPGAFPWSIHWPGTGRVIEGLVRDVGTVSIRRDTDAAWLDADRFGHDLIVRAWRPGDYFCPYGMGGRRKKIQDFFSDAKVRRTVRHRVPLVVAPEGILWIGGYRVDHRFRVTAATRRVAIVRLCAARDGASSRGAGVGVRS